MLLVAIVGALSLLILTSCSGGDGGDSTDSPSTAGPLPAGFLLYRDGTGHLVALELQSGESFRRPVDVANEAFLTAACTGDGLQIAYLRQDFNEVNREVIVAGANGTSEFKLPPGAQGITWSPDGLRIAFTAFDPQAGYTISILDLSTGEQSLQVSGTGVAGSPRWSPDGTRIAFHAPSGLLSQIWLYEIDSGAERATQMTDGAGAFDPDWSLDGERLIISSVAEDQSFQIFELDADTGETTQLTDSDVFKRLSRYSPEGDAIAFSGSVVVPVVSRTATDLHQFGVFLMAPDGSNEIAVTADPQLNPGVGIDPFLDALLIGWCPRGEWLDDTWTEVIAGAPEEQ